MLGLFLWLMVWGGPRNDVRTIPSPCFPVSAAALPTFRSGDAPEEADLDGALEYSEFFRG